MERNLKKPTESAFFHGITFTISLSKRSQKNKDKRHQPTADFRSIYMASPHSFGVGQGRRGVYVYKVVVERRLIRASLENMKRLNMAIRRYKASYDS